MHPPPFRLSQKLSDWPACSLELNCCKGRGVYPLRLMMRELSDRTFARVLPQLRCRTCGKPPAPVYLCAGHREGGNLGSPPDWAIELVPTGR
jgi:hypothetical protein